MDMDVDVPPLDCAERSQSSTSFKLLPRGAYATVSKQHQRRICHKVWAILLDQTGLVDEEELILVLNNVINLKTGANRGGDRTATQKELSNQYIRDLY